MPPLLETRPLFAGCGRVMDMRVRAPAQGGLPREWVCLRLDCRRFGEFTRGEDRDDVTTV